jgi:cell division protein FtsZ
MALDITPPENVILHPVITVFGVGGAGGNAINNMQRANLNGVEFVVANTDAQALSFSESRNKIQLGVNATRGMGAGATPHVGKIAAEESAEDIKRALEASNMVFITAGMGGGTGTGAAPVVAKIAKDMGILTVAVVTKPFLFEGAKRMRVAEEGILELQKYVDTLIIIPNQNLFRIANEHTTFQEAFAMADDVLHAGVRGITDLITSPGLVNLDFADIQTIMQEKGKAMMGTGEASGEDRALRAAEAAIANPLLDQSSIVGAAALLVNISGGRDLTLHEVDSSATRVKQEIGDVEANIIFGSTFNPELDGKIRVSVVATGINQKEMEMAFAREVADMPKDAVLAAVTADQEDSVDMLSDLNEYIGDMSLNENDLAAAEGYNLENDELSVDQQFARLAQQIEKRRSQTVASEQQSPKEETVLAPSRPGMVSKPKSSLLKRMWNSLKSGENTVENAAETIDEQVFAADRSNNVHEAPNFWKRK